MIPCCSQGITDGEADTKGVEGDGATMVAEDEATTVAVVAVIVDEVA